VSHHQWYHHFVLKVGDTIDEKTLDAMDTPSINNNGDVGFRGAFNIQQALFTLDSLLVQSGDIIGGETLGAGFDLPSPINDNGDMVFRTFVTGGNGVFTPTSLIAKPGDTIGGETLTDVKAARSINDNGDVIFRSAFTGGSGFFTATSLVAKTGDTISGETLILTTGVPDINNNGDVVFVAIFSDSQGIFSTIKLPEEQIRNIIEDLVADGTLSEQEGKKLTKKLDKVIKNMDKGKDNKACKELEKFIKVTQKLIDMGKLDETEGQSLIDPAIAIQDSIPC